MSRSLCHLAIPCALLACSACSEWKSRYAMSDPVYAAKYAEGAERGDIPGKIKQALDARHVAGLNGWSVSGGALYRPKSDETLAGGTIGFESYPLNWMSHHLGLATYISESEGFMGAESGLRFQFPSRVTPFAGVGGFVGASRTVVDTADGSDNDDDGFVDEPGEVYSQIDEFLVAIYPELGAHLWINGNWRASVSGRYFCTSLSDAHDDWMLGGQLTYFPRRGE